MKPELQDEERLTAYALGEADPAESAEIEAQIASDPARQAYVAEVRATAGALQRELQDEARGAGLTEAQKRGIAAVLGGAGVPVRETIHFAPRRIFTFYRVAAMLAVVVFAGALGMAILGRKSSDIIGTMAVILPGAESKENAALHNASAIELQTDGSTFRADANQITQDKTDDRLAMNSGVGGADGDAEFVIPGESAAKVMPATPVPARIITVPTPATPPALSRPAIVAQVQDHFESINPGIPDIHGATATADSRIFYGIHDAKDAAGGSGITGAELENVIGAGGNVSAGGWGGGNGIAKRPVPPVASVPAPIPVPQVAAADDARHVMMRGGYREKDLLVEEKSDNEVAKAETQKSFDELQRPPTAPASAPVAAAETATPEISNLPRTENGARFAMNKRAAALKEETVTEVPINNIALPFKNSREADAAKAASAPVAKSGYTGANEVAEKKKDRDWSYSDEPSAGVARRRAFAVGEAEEAPKSATTERLRMEAERRSRNEAGSEAAARPEYYTPRSDDADAAKKNANLGYSFTRLTTPECPPEPVTPPTPVVVAPGTEEYNLFGENGFKRVSHDPLSTFSLDVDTASYANVRRFLDQNQMPPPEAVRIEELINYFPFHYDPPTDGSPFAVHAQVAECPWNSAHRLVKLGVKAVDMNVNQRPPSNLVFLIDVSGSMNDPKRLPLVQEGLSMLVKSLNATDRVAIVTYADGSSVALPSTTCEQPDRILNVINGLHGDGSTNGGAGIQTAYRVASENFIRGGVNRVILATDGDFNVGITDPDQLVGMIKGQADAGIFLTALGCGMGNYKDARLQKLADGAHGNYAYVDNFEEIRKVLIEQLSATLVTVAKDVKVHVEFNPAQAYAYRLIGYEKRALANREFNDDSKDAGDLGAGHTVTALYEVIPGVAPAGTDLRYQPSPAPEGGSTELLTVKMRYKLHNESTSKLLAYALTDNGAKLSDAPADYKFAAAVAAFGMLLKHSPYAQAASYDLVESLANDSRGSDEGGYRREFAGLVRKAKELERR